MVSTNFSTANELASGVPAPVVASVSAINSGAGLDLKPSFHSHVKAMVKRDGDKRLIDEANGGSDGCLTMDVGFRVIRNNRYHQRQLGRHYEAWPHLHRLSQPCQEQPEDLSIKK